VGEIARRDKLICSCWWWCYDICTNKYWKSCYSI